MSWIGDEAKQEFVVVSIQFNCAMSLIGKSFVDDQHGARKLGEKYRRVERVC